MLTDYIAASLDARIYIIGRTGTMDRGIRRYRDRSALIAGDPVAILDYRSLAGKYGPEPRVLVSARDGSTRWIHPADITFTDEYPKGA